MRASPKGVRGGGRGLFDTETIQKTFFFFFAASLSPTEDTVSRPFLKCFKMSVARELARSWPWIECVCMLGWSDDEEWGAGSGLVSFLTKVVQDIKVTRRCCSIFLFFFDWTPFIRLHYVERSVGVVGDCKDTMPLSPFSLHSLRTAAG